MAPKVANIISPIAKTKGHGCRSCRQVISGALYRYLNNDWNCSKYPLKPQTVTTKPIGGSIQV